MGRLDNAMRRAAEERAAKSITMLDDQPLPAPDFPSEEEAPESLLPNDVASTEPARVELLPPAPAAPPQTAAPAAPPAVPAAVPAGPAPSGAPVVAGRETSLFHQMDARLATKTVVDSTMLPAS